MSLQIAPPPYRPYKVIILDGLAIVHSGGEGPPPNWWVRLWLFVFFKIRVEWDD